MIMMTKKWKKESWGPSFVCLTLRFLEHFILNGPDPKALDAVLAQLNDPKRQNPQELDRAVMGKPAHVSMINNILISHSLTVLVCTFQSYYHSKKLEGACVFHFTLEAMWMDCVWDLLEQDRHQEVLWELWSKLEETLSPTHRNTIILWKPATNELQCLNGTSLSLSVSLYLCACVFTEAHIHQVKNNLSKKSQQLIPAVFTNTWGKAVASSRIQVCWLGMTCVVFLSVDLLDGSPVFDLLTNGLPPASPWFPPPAGTNVSGFYRPEHLGCFVYTWPVHMPTIYQQYKEYSIVFS